MRILLTNDDGYNQEGILLLREVLKKIWASYFGGA